jgi:hypothetical protein
MRKPSIEQSRLSGGRRPARSLSKWLYEGHDLEDLVARLEGILSPDASIEVREKPRGDDNRQIAELDLVITDRSGPQR